MSLEPISNDEIRAEAMKRIMDDVWENLKDNPEFSDLQSRADRVRDIINAGERQFWHDLWPLVLLSITMLGVGFVIGMMIGQQMGR